MKNFRIQSLWWLVTLVTPGSSITLLEVLHTYPELSTLYGYVNASANVTGLLASANNFTFLAPSNDAFTTFNTPNPPAEDLLEATLQYSLLQGGFPTLSFSDTPQFVASNLVNASYANVTGGQAVELVLGTDGTPQVVTGNKSISTTISTDIVCTGGIVKMINEVISLPISAVLEITAAHLEYFISILNTGGYLSAQNTYVNDVLSVKDVTFFIPNSAEALANATQLAATSSAEEQEAFFQYHVVAGFVGYSPLLKDGLRLKTMQGDDLVVTIQDDDIYINAAKVITTDYIISNGVAHVIDSILDRNNTSPPPQPTSATSTPAPTASSAPTQTPVVNPDKSSSSKHTSGSTIGIAVGVSVAGLITLTAIALFIWSRKRKRESRAWNDQNMSGLPHDTGMQGIHVQDQYSIPYSSTAHRPIIPPRSPSRLRGKEF